MPDAGPKTLTAVAEFRRRTIRQGNYYLFEFGSGRVA